MDAIKHFISKHPIIANIILILAVGIIIVMGLMLFLASWTHHGETSTVPNIKGMSFEDAHLVLAENSLTIEISDSIYDQHAQPGTIVESWPRAGSVIKQNRQVYVTITAFSPKLVTIAMPVIGVSSRQAVSYLEALGISSIRITNVPSQFPDLVENAFSGVTPLSVGTSIPITASVTLEVGTAPIDELPADSLDIAIDSEIDYLLEGDGE